MKNKQAFGPIEEMDEEQYLDNDMDPNGQYGQPQVYDGQQQYMDSAQYNHVLNQQVAAMQMQLPETQHADQENAARA